MKKRQSNISALESVGFARGYIGERLDPESGKPHLAHAICCLMFLLEPEQESKPEQELGK